MEKYVDGFLVPVPVNNLDAYLELSRTAAAVWMEHGALEYVETVADDVKPGKLTSFPQSVNLEEGETVVFSWIVYRDREHRDSVNAKAMADPRLADVTPENMPFDARRLIWGGFKPAIWEHAAD